MNCVISDKCDSSPRLAILSPFPQTAAVHYRAARARGRH